MIGLGSYFLVITLWALWLRWRGKLWDNRPVLWLLVISVLGPYVANEVGWVEYSKLADAECGKAVETYPHKDL